MSEKCKSCGHYGLYQMITSGRPYGYGGDIPCHRCSECSQPHSEFTGVTENIDLSNEYASLRQQLAEKT